MRANGWLIRSTGGRCVYRPDSPNAAINGLRYAEVRALVADGVMTNDWRGPGDAIAINEHEKNALREFCSGVYEAWDRFQARTELERAA